MDEPDNWRGEFPLMENFSKQRREMGRGGETEWEKDRERDFISKTELELKLIF